MKYQVQVDSDHYFVPSYLDAARWASYWHQIEAVIQLHGKAVLEIGVGNGIVRDSLQKLGFAVQTVDIDPALLPDVVGSVTSIPLPDASVDTVLAAEILEHIAWGDLDAALGEIRRVMRHGAVVSVPNAGYTLACEWKLPLLPRQRWIWRLPHFWKNHHFDGEHYWELGKKGYSAARFREALSAARLRIVAEGRWPDDPIHHYFLAEKVFLNNLG